LISQTVSCEATLLLASLEFASDFQPPSWHVVPARVSSAISHASRRLPSGHVANRGPVDCMGYESGELHVAIRSLSVESATRWDACTARLDGDQESTCDGTDDPPHREEANRIFPKAQARERITAKHAQPKRRVADLKGQVSAATPIVKRQSQHA
jgi:hypothetical protein